MEGSVGAAKGVMDNGEGVVVAGESAVEGSEGAMESEESIEVERVQKTKMQIEKRSTDSPTLFARHMIPTHTGLVPKCGMKSN